MATYAKRRPPGLLDRLLRSESTTWRLPDSVNDDPRQRLHCGLHCDRVGSGSVVFEPSVP